MIGKWDTTQTVLCTAPCVETEQGINLVATVSISVVFGRTEHLAAVYHRADYFTDGIRSTLGSDMLTDRPSSFVPCWMCLLFLVFDTSKEIPFRSCKLTVVSNCCHWEENKVQKLKDIFDRICSILLNILTSATFLRWRKSLAQFLLHSDLTAGSLSFLASYPSFHSYAPWGCSFRIHMQTSPWNTRH